MSTCWQHDVNYLSKLCQHYQKLSIIVKDCQQYPILLHSVSIMSIFNIFAGNFFQAEYTQAGEYMRWVWAPESQKPRQRVSNADQKVFANPEIFRDKFIIDLRIPGYLAIQNIQIICKVSGWTGKFPDNLKSVRIIKKMYMYNLKRVCMI